MAIFYSYIIWPSSTNLVSTLKGKKILQKKVWNFSILGQIQAGSGSGIFGFCEKLPESATLN